MRPHKVFFYLACIVLLVLGTAVGQGAEQRPGVWMSDASTFETDSYTAGWVITKLGQVKSPIPQAVWQDAVDTSTSTYFPNRGVILTAQHAVYVSRGQLLARHPRTGEVLWRTGGNLLPVINEHRSVIYTANRDGIIAAFRSTDGRRIWSTPTDFWRVDQLAVIDGLLLINDPQRGLMALRADTGAPAWRGRGVLEGLGNDGVLVAYQGIAFAWGVWGEPNMDHFIGLRLRDGGVLWSAVAGSPFTIKGSLVYVRDKWMNPDALNTFTIEARDPSTGDIRRRWSYELRSSDPLINPRFGRALIQGEYVFLDMGCNLQRLRLGPREVVVFGIRGTACQSTVRDVEGSFEEVRRQFRHILEDRDWLVLSWTGKPGVTRVSYRGETAWLAGPYRGRLLLWDGRILYALATNTGRTVDYAAVRHPVFRLRLSGNRVYVGDAGGWFSVHDLNTGAVMFRAFTGARNWDIRVGSDVILVQAEQTLVAFRDP